MQTARRSIRVVKLGGSLFDLPDLFATLARVLADEISAKKECTQETWLVPGGGEFANEIRRLDGIHRWPDQTAHQLAIQSMSLAARMLTASHPLFELMDDLEAGTTAGRIGVLDVSRLKGLEVLPAVWDMTSDSIAAWIASRWEAQQLLLLKSVSLPAPLPTPEFAARTGWVDRSFPRIAAGVEDVSWMNLRMDVPTSQHWLTQGEVVSW